MTSRRDGRSCARCLEPIIWAISDAGGKLMPLNPPLIAFVPDPEGKLLLVVVKDQIGKTVRGREPEAGEELTYGRISHFANCPNANEFRRKK